MGLVDGRRGNSWYLTSGTGLSSGSSRAGPSGVPAYQIEIPKKIYKALNHAVRKHYSDRINSANNVQRAWKVIDSLMAKDNQNRHDNISLVIQGGLCTGPREVAENFNNYCPRGSV